MKYSINNINSNDLKKLQQLVKLTIDSEENINWRLSNGYNNEFTILPINHKTNFSKFIDKGSYNLTTIIHPHGLSNNIEIAKFINKITNRSLNDINSLHHIKYSEGVFLPRHIDVFIDDVKFEKTNTFTFLLEMCEDGGNFLLDDEDTNFNTPGQYIEFDGREVFHEVKEVKKGIREVLVVWYKPKNSKII
jgi:hypothetical protein